MKLKYVSGFIFCCILIAVMISCNNLKETDAQEKESNQSSTIESALIETNRQIEKAIYDSDYEKLINFYTDDAIVASDFQPAIKEKDAIRSSYLKQEKEGTKFHSFNAKADKIWQVNNDIYEYGTYGLSVSSNETKHPYAFTGSYFMIWEKQKNDGYLIKYMISNLDFDPCNDFY
ncbi:MAG TPA: DUF4440 domain-containing protein [Melioribacteraceae bacterium]|nr:DUF4440 domain-containing protein [Melioribacteraceae bacterium]